MCLASKSGNTQNGVAKGRLYQIGQDVWVMVPFGQYVQHEVVVDLW